MTRYGTARNVQAVGRATYLFKVPGALDGLAEVFNMPGVNHVIYKTSPSAAVADRRAIAQDWAAYGDDLRAVYDAVAKPVR